MTASASYELGPLYPAQREAIFGDVRISAIEASTKSGKTSGCLVWLIDQALRNGAPNRTFWWVAPVTAQAALVYRRAKLMLPRELYVPHDTTMTLRLANGARIEFKSGERPNGLYGDDVHAVVLDEASRMREEAWHAVRSTLTATGGPVRMIGNVRGRRNWFWRFCRAAEAGREGAAYHRLTWRDAVGAGVIEAEEIDAARIDLPEHVFRELYEAEATEDGSNPFGADAIRDCIAALGNGPAIRFGIDVARARDYTVAIGLNGEVGVCTFERFQLPWTETLARIDETVGGVRALVDSTGVGDAILEALQRPIYKGDVHPQAEHGLKIRSAVGNYEGYVFSSTSKQALMERLALAIQRREVSFPDGPIVAELDAFEFEYGRTGVRYSAPPGMHDDCVCALALAVWHMPVRTTGGGRAPSGPVQPGGSKWSGMGGASSGYGGSKWR